MGERILIVEDKESMAEMLRTSLSSEGYDCSVASNGVDGIRMFQSEPFDLVLTDLRLPRKGGLKVLKSIRSEDPSIPVIIMTAYGTIETAVEAMKNGANDFITKPFDMDHLLLIIKRVMDTRRLYRENLLLKDEFITRAGLPNIIGRSEKIMDVIKKVQRVAPTRSTVLLLGESGTGKELFARAIHYLSPRRDNLFVPVNCAAIPRELLESELFGHERGAFTGAEVRKSGKFELANNGTIFLDEVGELELSLQAKLLRVLQDQMVEHIGGTRPVKIDVRVVAASNRNLFADVKDGRFREDLFYRLNVFPILIPPLRERKDDIPMLAEFFIGRFASEMKKERKRLSEGSINLLTRYDWKGNVRELENTIERAMILADGDAIEPAHISLMPVGHVHAIEGISMDGTLEEAARAAQRIAETMMIRDALDRTRWNKSRAAEILNISYKTLLTKIKEYGIDQQNP